MNISTARLLLTEITWKDLDDMHRLHSIFEVEEFNTMGLPENIDETRQNLKPFIDAKKMKPRPNYAWAIRNTDPDEFVGMAGMTLSNDRFRIGEIFHKFYPEHWGKGYATEVSGKLIDLGFLTFHLHRIEAGCAIKNSRSIRVLEKCGMTREGTLRKILPIRGEWVDSYLYSILEDEYLKNK